MMSGTARSKTSKINTKKLEVLLEVTNAINSNAHTEDLLHNFRDFLENYLKIAKLALFVKDNDWSLLLHYGFEQTPDIDVNEHLTGYSEISPLATVKDEKLKIYDIVIPVFHKDQPLAYLLLGDIYGTEKGMSPTVKHLPFIQTLTNIIIVAIENKRMAKEKLLQEGFKRELELAGEMQSMLFPNELPNDNKIEAAAYYQPHREVTGDYFDFIDLSENEVLFCMADVSGKGISAALLMSNFQANIRALATASISLTDLARELNCKVMASAKGEKYITIFLARYNKSTGIMHFLNAGHNPPVLITGDIITLLQTGSPALGMFDELAKVKEGIISIDKNSVLLCYTDGVVELENEKGEDFGIENLKTELVKHKHLPMKEVNQKIIEALMEYKGANPYFDDVTLLSCRFR
jgi:phosphoserine phosphatase RsbU/P